MIGLPGQTLADAEATVQALLGLPVDHISFYSLSLEEGTPLQKQCAANPDLLPDELTEREQYHRIRQMLRQAGFEHYEISNAARPGHRCRHNLVYWSGNPYYGFGAAAHSYLQGVRRSNPAGLDAYIGMFGKDDRSAGPSGRPGEGLYPAGRVEETVDGEGARKEMLMLGLRLLEGVRSQDFYDRFGCDLQSCFAGQISQLVRRGLLQADADGIRLTLAGLDLANQVFCEFV
ncbi:MAG TPA: hypothetical protein DD640_10155 [Clostridiales bacterium]|nr:hypothetical protein [Clostridiales bacterium]